MDRVLEYAEEPILVLGTEPTVTLVKSLEYAYDILQNGSSGSKIDAIEAIQCVASGERAVTQLCQCASSQSFASIAAIRALQSMGPLDDDVVIPVLIDCSQVAGGHFLQDIRLAAVKALSKLSEPNDYRVLEA